MGIIQRQGFKNSTVQVLGAIIAAVAVIKVYPNDFELYGLFGFLSNTALFLAPIMSFGTATLVVKFFPKFKDKAKGHNGFLFYSLLTGTMLFLLFGVVLFGLKGQLFPLMGKLEFDTEMIVKLSIPLFILVYLNILASIFYSWMSNFKRITVPAILDYLMPKIVVPAIFLAILYKALEKTSFVQYYIYLNLAVLIGLILYTAQQGQLKIRPDFTKLKKSLLKKMASFQIYSGLSSMGTMLTMRIDSIMVATLSGLTQNGIYFLLQNITYMMYIPLRSLYQISAPIISGHFASKEYSQVNSMYKSASANMLFIGILLFGCLWINVEDLFLIIGKPELVPHKNVILFLGLAVLFDMTNGINNQIMLYSDLYKWNLWLVLLMGGLNVLLNYLFIRTLDFGLIGAAYATMISIILYNVLKMLLIYIKYQLQPFSEATIGLILVGFPLIILGMLTDLPLNSYLNILLKSFVYGSLFLVIIHRYGWANEATFAVLKNLKNLLTGKKIKL
jgi:O-antigen/teichoic acid export membrane protein